MAYYWGMRTPKQPEPDTGAASRAAAAYRHAIRPQNNPQESASAFVRTEPCPKNAKQWETRFNKTLEKKEKERAESSGDAPAPESKYRRVAKLLVLIGSEEASKILSHLESAQVEAVAAEIAGIRSISAEEAASVILEFRSLLSHPYRYADAAGGVETARDLLHAAFGREKGEAILRRTVPDSRLDSFDFLEKLPGEQLVLLFKDETVAAEALILSRLPPKLAAEVLAASPPERKVDLIRRIARLDKTSPEVLERIAGALQEKVRRMGDAVRTDTGSGVDGLNALSAILKSADPSFGERILDELGAEDPYLRADLKERLNTLDDVVKAEDRAIQDKLFSMSDHDIVLLLKNRSVDFTEKILANISAERRAHIREETDVLGPVRKRDVDKVAKEFLDWFRENREAGHILLLDDEDIVL
ncbi:MAG: flagellar motor switch protein FliG [Spirochaetaceae bacterium]|jgi:flagellar motor switch protein FliG|nr:flagellar motor switch protein FliG [Spirochaetaceae bacterium]